jgi:hypothetical protein
MEDWLSVIGILIQVRHESCLTKLIICIKSTQEIKEYLECKELTVSVFENIYEKLHLKKHGLLFSIN